MNRIVKFVVLGLFMLSLIAPLAGCTGSGSTSSTSGSATGGATGGTGSTTGGGDTKPADAK